MTYQRLPYDDASDTTDMMNDCAEVGRAMPSALRQPHASPAASRAQAPADTVVVPDDLAEMAAGLQLHFD
jgi:hypothetical protein